MTSIMDGQLTWQDLDTSFGRMCQEQCLRETQKEQTSKPSSRKSSKSSAPMLPMCLCLKTESGANPGASMTRWVDGQLLGEYTMHSFGESPSVAVESLLSQILEECPHPKYSLSEKACLGILRRAERRGKELPGELREALERQSVSHP